MRTLSVLTLSLSLLVFSCNEKTSKEPVSEKGTSTDSISQPKDSIQEKTSVTTDKLTDTLTNYLASLPDSSFVEVNTWKNSFVFDMKYATDDNFLKEKVYDCGKCALRAEVLRGLLKASAHFESKGYKIKFFDCYRPLYIQKKMWAILPDARYVANPSSGSVHNRGAAVDITLVDSTGKEVDMGTNFDHFGKEAHHAYTNLTPAILANRKLLKEGMEGAGFKSISTEWWHYNFTTKISYPVSNTPIVCE